MLKWGDRSSSVPAQSGFWKEAEYPIENELQTPTPEHTSAARRELENAQTRDDISCGDLRPRG